MPTFSWVFENRPITSGSNINPAKLLQKSSNQFASRQKRSPKNWIQVVVWLYIYNIRFIVYLKAMPEGGIKKIRIVKNQGSKGIGQRLIN